MQVVGVDFGTTNVRIAVWDSEGQLTPAPLLIGQGGESTMPAVIAQEAGAILPIVGEEADGLSDDDDVVVIRNIKRWALSSDDFVRWHLDTSQTPQPKWWNPETRCVKAFGEDFPIWQVIRQILAEAFRRAGQVGLQGEFQWRAGCPVQADLQYRSELASALAEFGDGNSVSSVIEEPVLFLALAHRLETETLRPGSYLVYDLGGGSFDCALAELETDGQMTVYSSSGDPLLGGSTIDRLLTERLSYNGSSRLLRLAKEQLAPSNPEQALENTRVTWSDLEGVLKASQFIDRTRAAMREAYISAKVIWKSDAEAPTLGGSGIPSLRLGNMAAAFAKDLDGIILFGGSTRSPFFRERLTEIFGAERIIAAERLIPAEIPDPELTGLSIGACYAFTESRAPLYVRRLPARITLRNTRTRDSVTYEPYQHFVPNFSPARPFVSAPLPQADARARYELTVADPDGAVIHTQRVDFGNPANTRSLRLVIDALGRIGVESNGSVSIEVDAPPWQTQRQREVLQSAIERRDQAEQARVERARRMFTDNLFGYELVGD